MGIEGSFFSFQFKFLQFLLYFLLKLFVGNVDRSTKVVNWFKVKLFARYARIKPNTSNQGICMRVEIIGCNSGKIYLNIHQ